MTAQVSLNPANVKTNCHVKYDAPSIISNTNELRDTDLVTFLFQSGVLAQSLSQWNLILSGRFQPDTSCMQHSQRPLHDNPTQNCQIKTSELESRSWQWHKCIQLDGRRRYRIWPFKASAIDCKILNVTVQFIGLVAAVTRPTSKLDSKRIKKAAHIHQKNKLASFINLKTANVMCRGCP